MKKVFVSITLLLYTLGTAAQKPDSLLVFTDTLEWSSFRGVPDVDTFGARISTTIYVEVSKANIWTGTTRFKAVALMSPSKSWVRVGYTDQYTLAHEQTHFNITEVYARGLEAELNRLKIRSRKSPLIEATLTKWSKDMEDLQKQYDQETKSGRDRVAQKIWNERIRSRLTKTD